MGAHLRDSRCLATSLPQAGHSYTASGILEMTSGNHSSWANTFASRSPHSQIMITVQPAARNASRFLASRDTFASNFVCQFCSLDRGVVVYLHPGWRCQKQPWTKMAVRYLGSARSGRPGNFSSCSVYLNPRRCKKRRTANSGFVSLDRIPDIIRERVALSTTSMSWYPGR